MKPKKIQPISSLAYRTPEEDPFQHNEDAKGKESAQYVKESLES
jgi:hypothetical protein